MGSRYQDAEQHWAGHSSNSNARLAGRGYDFGNVHLGSGLDSRSEPRRHHVAGPAPPNPRPPTNVTALARGGKSLLSHRRTGNLTFDWRDIKDHSERPLRPRSDIKRCSGGVPEARVFNIDETESELG